MTGRGPILTWLLLLLPVAGAGIVLPDLDLAPGAALTARVNARCGADPCVRCSATQAFTVQTGGRVDLKLTPAPSCGSGAPPAACASCLPGPDESCDGNQRVSCPPSGSTLRQPCPAGQSCSAGKCVQGCVAKTWYHDADHDNFGNPALKVTACDQPVDSVDNDKDCSDVDQRVHPGQTAYFEEPAVGGGYDYDCSGVAEKEYPAVFNCKYEAGNCTGFAWMLTAAECGESKVTLPCSNTRGQGCVPSWAPGGLVQRRQRCH